VGDEKERDSAAESEINRLRLENQKLRDENERLTRLVGSRDAQPISISHAGDAIEPKWPTNSEQSTSGVTRLATPSAKIALFRNLFRGREDVYAYRWENRAGKSGYSPSYLQKSGDHPDALINSASGHDQRQCDPITESVIRDHLTGKRVIGLFPLISGDRCWFLAVDFDKKSWQTDVLEFLQTCREHAVPAIIERSRSGKGAHIWIFFLEAVEAAVARKLGSQLLTLTMERRHQLGLDSYDRLFPNQDTIPKNGFGNLIALPLQGEARKQGNSVFVDDQLCEHSDQWKVLASAQKLCANTVQTILRSTSGFGDETGVRAGFDLGDPASPWSWRPSRQPLEKPIPPPLPQQIRVVRSDLFYVEKAGLSSALIDRFIRLAAFQNPDFYRAQAMRFSTYGKPRIIACAEEYRDHLGLPRGCFDDFSDLCKKLGVDIEIRDERCDGSPIESAFQGTLRPEQSRAAAEVIRYENGVLCAPTAFGKTVLAAWIVAHRRVSTLILVHRRQLADQWRERLSSFLAMSPKAIGAFGGGRDRRTGKVDIATLQSIGHKGVIKDWVADYGQIIVDECHHVSAFSFEAVLKRAKARFVLGLTATPNRKDGHEPIVHMQCGPIRFHAGARSSDMATVRQAVIPVPTAFAYAPANHNVAIQDLYNALAADDARNRLIVELASGAVANGRRPLILTARTAHVELLAEGLRERVEHVFILKGGIAKNRFKAVQKAMADLDDSSSWVIVATGSFIGEGYDEQRLDALILAMPISWRGTLQQYVGRLHRVHAEKHEVLVYDLVDINEPVLMRMYKRRVPGYRTLGYEIEQFPNADSARF
jgi:superfamily II DNA or RNA helicase